jgi:hypothetical protein
MLKQHTSELVQQWDQLRRDYLAPRPQFTAFRQPGTHYLQLDLGGKATHYEWKFLKAPTFHIEVAMHFEGPTLEENLSALALLDGRETALRSGTLTPLISGRWGRKWTRLGYQVDMDDPDDAVRRSAELMHVLVDRTYPYAKDLLNRSAETGWSRFYNHGS